MKKLLPVLFAIGVAASSTSAQESGSQLGDYGYGHSTLHKLGIIDQLMEKNGTNRCDGGKGGECRMTTIRYQSPTPMALLNGVWCPVTATIYTDIVLPPGTEAVVCAETATAIGACPTTYCAAAALNM